MSRVFLRKGRAKPIWGGHPWVLSGAVSRVEGEPAPGDLVTVCDDDGKPIGRGFWSPSSRVRVRVLTLDPGEEIDDRFLARRIRRAAERRVAFGLPGEDTDVFRLVHGDGDALPGVVADRFADTAVIQLTVRGMEDRREAIARALTGEAGIRHVRLRAVPSLAEAEGLEGHEGPLAGEPPEIVDVVENGVRFRVDIARGQKTGHFSDHRENRVVVRRLAAGRRTLDAFTGTGGFALAAALAGAPEVIALDSSPGALEAAERNAVRNGIESIQFRKDDVFRALRRLEKEGERFGLVVVDPPRMASRRKEVRGALRGYRELNLRAMRLLEDGGVLATASCTGLVSDEEFEKALRDAAFDAKRTFTVQHRGAQGPDHPWSVAAPEGRYLKFLVGRVSLR